MKVRLRLEHIVYPHMGAHAGYFQFARHLNRQHFEVDTRGTPDSDEHTPVWLGSLKPALQRRFANGPTPWYKVSNLAAELGILPDMFARRIDVVHFLDGEHTGSLVPKCARLSRVTGAKTVATFHQPPSIAKDVIDTKVLRWFDHIVLVSPSQIPFFMPYVPRNRLHVLLHGVDADFFFPKPAATECGPLRCITVGHWLRDYDAFKDVAAALQGETNISFDVVSNRKLGIENLPNVRVHANITDDQLAALYRSADVLFLPLVDSTANNALLEGMASGLAVVTTDMESTRAYLPNGEAILVKGNERRAFIAALRELQSNAEMRRERSHRARQRALELSWSRLAVEYGAFYRSLGRRAPPQ